MSASNWNICPRCKEDRVEELENAVKSVNESYGTISQSEYLRKVEGLVKIRNKEIEKTLREDYEIGVDESFDFHLTYICRCTCGFFYKKSERLDVKKEIINA